MSGMIESRSATSVSPVTEEVSTGMAVAAAQSARETAAKRIVIVLGIVLMNDCGEYYKVKTVKVELKAVRADEERKENC